MIDFEVKCPKNYPLKCSLTNTEKEALIRSEKHKGFLMYQFIGQTDYVIPKVKEHFKPPLYYLFDAQEQSGLGIKSCKICRLALASDFGVASLTPLNNNVFFEVGLMQGLGKPVVYLVDRNFEHNGQKGAKAVPFDLSDQIVIEHENADKLSFRLEKEIPMFIEKVQSSTVYEKEFVKFVKGKLQSLDPKALEALKYCVLEQATSISSVTLEKMGISDDVLNELRANGLIKAWYVQDSILGFRRINWEYALEEKYREILEELLFKE